MEILSLQSWAHLFCGQRANTTNTVLLTVLPLVASVSAVLAQAREDISERLFKRVCSGAGADQYTAVFVAGVSRVESILMEKINAQLAEAHG